MLKKTGIVAAAIAASLLAVTPLAFAGGKDPDSDSHSKKKDSDDDKDKAKSDDSDDDDDADDDDSDDDSDDSDDNDDNDDNDDSDDDSDDDTSTINTDNVSSDCTFAQAGGDTSAPLSGGNSGLLGVINLAANVVAPITAQAPLLSCNNVNLEDTVDLVTINPSTDNTEIDGG